jgi:hypothetical protein
MAYIYTCYDHKHIPVFRILHRRHCTHSFLKRNGICLAVNIVRN